MNHATNVQLQEYLDQRLDPTRSREIQDHLKNCKECADRMAGFQRLEIELGRFPLEKVSDDFTHRVMRGISWVGDRGLVQQLLVNLLPLVAVSIIVALLGGAFSSAGSNESPLSREAGQYAESLQQTIGGALSSGTATIFEWARKVADLSASIPSIHFILGLLLAFAVITLFDEFVFVPMMKKRG